ncbi:hTAFII28-like protein conserved region-domain-containing protein [Xylogone sp. PMI_703]|nr:hTAFII28-like protein conserved region-domain-containing protein [Xylogone sp. PMI_703]
MASPPYSHSYNGSVSTSYASNPPLPQPPKRRQSDMPFSGPTVKRRKASMVSTTSSNHPLRQTSFPPENASETLYSRSPSVETMSLVSGSGVGSQQKKKRGRKSKSGVNGNDDTASVSAFGGPALTAVSGTSGGRGRPRRPSKGESDDEDEGGEGMTVEIAAGTLEEKQKEIEHRAMLVNAFDPEQFSRYEAWRSSKLSDAIVRRIVNQTLSQSAPASVILAVKSVAKMFAGEMIEGARKVQSEWISLEEPEEGKPKEDETRRGPLLPDHLREAIRRYKMGREGCLAGQLGLWQHQSSNGVERFAVKVMGKRLFK